MLTAYSLVDNALQTAEGLVAPEVLRAAIWIDLLTPTREEERHVETALGSEMPTREEMEEIESSSRLYKEGEVLYLTAPFLQGVDLGDMESSPITFVLDAQRLVTVRYATPKAFAMFASRCQRSPAPFSTGDGVMLLLFEQVVDRLADILERIGADMDRASRAVFRTARGNAKVSQKDRDLKGVLITLGQVGDITTRASETLLGLSRILTFVGAEKATVVHKDNLPVIKSLVRDVRSLVEHASILNGKANFLLDAVLGIINAEQTSIIKTFTLVSVALMPPTLIASVYGMNFEMMPELGWRFGYPAALVLMVVSAVLPVLYFKRKGWL